MTDDLHSIPEFASRHAPQGLLRLPPGEDVPLTPRIRRLIDTPAFRRLSDVSQLGLVRMVYPGAGHSRFEHSLGVYRVALDFLERLASDTRFAGLVTARQAECFLLAALLHDIGHYPYCHPLEDIALDSVIHHEATARTAITEGPVAAALADDWNVSPQQVADLIEGRVDTPGERALSSMLSGPIDVDKVDYLARDSMHCGVPYGRNFDQRRLVSSLCLNASGDRLAVTEKGKTAAELMVFARYVMFSEVYWHHAARSATAMLQRAVYDLENELDWGLIFSATDEQFASHLLAVGQGRPAEGLVRSLFGGQRQLYKRVGQYSLLDSPAVYELVARRPYEWLVNCSTRLAERIADKTGEVVASHDVLIDAPPVKLEVQFNVDVYSSKANTYRPLGEVSPVVRTLAREQFDNYVKRVRVFASPPVANAVAQLDLDELLTLVAS
ncbi:HD domain-containing protein [Aeoliella sp. ICT_H6.2]|uniref:HD domain-containing protein n=1 Tax=Aeoliella straminimaris TaxID=2954799 RepID=A0A9X2FAG8_9BACT|nr:HD domain-containing protein [Aeoliella straminimaris]MCO6044527.1 HD domain-containing protein [Aeoliella straminimaris]